MWIFTVYGFYSISAKQGSPRVFIRARDKQHLLNLKARVKDWIGKCPVITTPNRDYGYRLSVPKDVWVEIAANLAEEQTWDNFKSECTRRFGTRDPYIAALHEVWYRMSQLQPYGWWNLWERNKRQKLTAKEQLEFDRLFAHVE